MTSWATVGERTFARAVGSACDWSAIARACECVVDVPPLAVVRIRPLAAHRLDALTVALAGPGRPKPVVLAAPSSDDLLVAFEATGAALHLILTVVDITLAATPGRTISPVLPIEDELLAQYAALRVRDSKLTASRVLDRYVEILTGTSETDA